MSPTSSSSDRGRDTRGTVQAARRKPVRLGLIPLLIGATLPVLLLAAVLGAGWAALLSAVLAVWIAVLWPQLRALRALVRAARGGGTLPWDGRRPPWWMAREVAGLLAAIPAARRAAEYRIGRARDARALLQVCSDADPHVAALCDERGLVLQVNRAAQRLLGLPREQLLGCPIERFVPEEDRAALRTAFALACAGETAGAALPTRRQLLLRHDGMRVPVRLTIAVARHRGSRLLCLHGEDLRAEERRTQELKQSLAQAEALNEAKARFLANVSHEIRTPLNGLTGMLDLLRGTRLDADQREFFEVARTSARQLRALLNDLLDLSKMEAGKLAFENIPFDVREQLGNTLRAFGAAAQGKGLQLEAVWDVPQQLLMGDPYRIGQVLNNLLDNALKFTEQGSVSVRVQTRLLGDDGERCELRVQVCDTGIGVPADRVDSIFDAFAQAEESTTRRYGGTGLGLSLCRQLCERMGGGIAVAPRPGGGSVFTFHVVCGVAHGMSPFEETQPDVDLIGDVLSGCRVLVVDDNRVNQTLLQRWLQREQIEVTALGDGESAVRAVAGGHFDAVLMDVSMPVMNGLDATRAIRALALKDVPDSCRFARLPIIGVSANAMQGDREACLASGMDDYVTKPIQRDVLLARMAQAISAARAQPRAPELEPIRLDL